MFGKQELVEALQSMVHEHGKKSSKKEEGKKAVTNEWLQQALPKLQDPALRVLLSLAPDAQPAASSAPGAGGRSAGFAGGAAEISHTASGAAPLAGGGSGAGGSASRRKSPLAAGPAGSGAGAFGAQHLAHVLCAAFPSMAAMKRLVQDVKAKSDAFRPVQLSSQADGGAYTREQIAARIVECRPLHVDNAGQLLSWLTVCVTPKPF